jgi:hypothetical protein
MNLKETIYNMCLQALEEKIAPVKSAQNDLRESASNETKSTAGDKHETALAMLQIEQKNIAAQLENLNSQVQILKRLKDVDTTKRIANGSLVETDKGYFYLSIPLGKMRAEEKLFTVLSAQSPLGNSFLGAEPGQEITFNKTSYRIKSIS